MTRMHVNLRVSDLEKSVAFYSRFFGSAPTVRKPDYAKWRLDDPCVNFAVGLGNGTTGVEHLGIGAETHEELERLRGRFAGGRECLENEGETVCCYARSDKSWATDPEGISWEMFYTKGSADGYGESVAPAARTGDCCATDTGGTDRASETEDCC